MNNDRITYLLDRFATRMLTGEELQELLTLMNDDDTGETIKQLLLLHGQTPASVSLETLQPSIDMLLKADEPTSMQTIVTGSVHRIHFLKTAWFRYAAAIIIVFGIGAYLWNTTQKKEQITSVKPAAEKNDIQPGFDRAVLTLSDGSKVELNNAASGTITDGTVPIRNSNGQLSYSDEARGSLSPAGGSGAGGAEGGREARTATNTMTTPKGGQYKLTLSDGTKVWLNAASSITYPVIFTRKTREVSISGEAYFEVVKNQAQPFVVKAGKQEITVLGTSFNVNAYADEPFMKTSLAKGAIKIGGHILKPGQADVNGTIVTTNLDQDLAWKNGIFNVESMTVEQAMRQVSRWYDVQIVYDKGPVTAKLSGKMDRNLTLHDLLQGLDGMGARYKLAGKTVHVIAL